MTVTAASKPCRKCGVTKLLEHFPRNAYQPDGRQAACRVCVKAAGSLHDCDASGCLKESAKAGLCQTHYSRMRANGTYDRLRVYRFDGREFNTPHEMAIYIAETDWGDDCLEWPGTFARNGYGKFHYIGKWYQAARFILSVASGAPYTNDLECAHAPVICHNKRCVNVRHLRWATTQENHADRYLDGTNGAGEANYWARLTRSQARAVYRATRLGIPRERIAEHFGVSVHTVRLIRFHNRWAEATADLRARYEA